MKKLIGAIGGCIAAYYVLDTLAAVSMACAWGDLVKYGHKYCKRNRKVFDRYKSVLFKKMKKKESN